MAQGKTHDAITLWTSPLVAGGIWWLTGNSGVALIAGGSFLFSGLMFSGDLDIHSNQYRRWGFLRWLWLPYRRLIPHRSVWSHGLLVGTVGRVLYLGLWLALGGALAWAVSRGMGISWSTGALQRSDMGSYALWSFVGLELGSLSHSLADTTSTGYKRIRKRFVKSKR
ncbi:metal-binding protein [Anthocerotibacter panamensis]|uniref:metal-binding protein n=1 Tax=Anthocerotibacter panamensis TaxID=2857077 RepID=UPI001C402321|nr:metal-binding protein [Anthocerotibacter panamensis]